MTTLGALDQNDTQKIKIKDYIKLVEKRNKSDIAKLFYFRLYNRYIKVFEYDSSEFKKNYKNGFSIMANSCLLIETFMSFRHKDLINTKRKSRECFCRFFTESKRFRIFAKNAFDEQGILKLKKTEGGIPNQFYDNVRCGILHLGETRKGWKISRKKSVPLFDENANTINATKFLDLLNKEIRDYSERLKELDWNSDQWDNFRTKMDTVIKNCYE